MTIKEKLRLMAAIKKRNEKRPKEWQAHGKHSDKRRLRG